MKQSLNGFLIHVLVILIAYSVEQLIEPLNNIGGTGFRKQPFIPYFGKIGSDKNPADQNLFERAPYFPVGNPDGPTSISPA